MSSGTNSGQGTGPGTRQGMRKGLSRRTLLQAGGGALALGHFPLPAIAQGRRDLRVGVYGGDFGNVSPVVRLDSQGALIAYNVFDGLIRIDYPNRKILPWLAEAWSQPD